MKASPLLRAWLARLAGLGVRIRPRHRWLGSAEAGASASWDRTARSHPRRRHVLALGGASWPRLGSDAGWTRLLPGVAITELQPANCGFTVAWSEHFRSRFEGQPLKRVALRFGAGFVAARRWSQPTASRAVPSTPCAPASATTSPHTDPQR